MFTAEENYEHVNYLFDHKQADEIRKTYSDLKFNRLVDKPNQHLSNMVVHLKELCALNYRLNNSAVYITQETSSMSEYVFGAKLEADKLIGTSICTVCLEKSIVSCQEIIDVLSDVKAFINAHNK